jgi:hypothetical protein
MKNSTAQIAKVSIFVLTIACMAVTSKLPVIAANPVVSIAAGITLAIVMGNLLKVVSRKQRERVSN